MNTTYPSRNYGITNNRLFTLADALFGDRPAADAPSWTPPVDVIESENQYELLVELPGVNGNEVKVVVRENVLSLSGERPAVPLAEGSRSHLSERRHGSFQRRFALPKDANGEQVRAEFRNGLLTVSIPKREEVKPREIEIQVS